MTTRSKTATSSDPIAGAAARAGAPRARPVPRTRTASHGIVGRKCAIPQRVMMELSTARRRPAIVVEIARPVATGVLVCRTRTVRVGCARWGHTSADPRTALVRVWVTRRIRIAAAVVTRATPARAVRMMPTAAARFARGRSASALVVRIAFRTAVKRTSTAAGPWAVSAVWWARVANGTRTARAAFATKSAYRRSSRVATCGTMARRPTSTVGGIVRAAARSPLARRTTIVSPESVHLLGHAV